MSKPSAVPARPGPSHTPMLASADGIVASQSCLTLSGALRGVLVTFTVTGWDGGQTCGLTAYLRLFGSEDDRPQASA